MDKNIRRISRDIRSGKLPEENIPQLFNYLAEYYNNYAELRLAMHYFAFYESYCDDEDTWSKESLQYTDQINLLIRDSVLIPQIGAEREKAIHTVDKIRKDITKRVENLTAYTDIFQIYEYVLNRIEYRFKAKAELISEDEFAKEILQYIFNSDDNFIINEKIKDMIGQLPIRITKQKYFELLEGSMQAYLGAEKSSFETYLYMIRTSAMLYQEDSMATSFPELWKKNEKLSKMSFKDITKADYDKALSILQTAILTLETETSVYLSLQEIVNEVYAILLCTPYAGMVSTDDAEVKEAALSIIQEISGDFVNRSKVQVSDDMIDQFTDMEGVQEELSENLSEMEDALYDIRLNQEALTKSLMLDQLLQVLLRTQNLLSNSLFIDLDEESRTDEVVDEERIEQERKLLEEELTALFDKSDRMISRAVMANTMNKMPVFFADHKEVMDYVRYSLDRCSDLYEKAACFEIINDIMKSE